MRMIPTSFGIVVTTEKDRGRKQGRAEGFRLKVSFFFFLKNTRVLKLKWQNANNFNQGGRYTEMCFLIFCTFSKYLHLLKIKL